MTALDTLQPPNGRPLNSSDLHANVDLPEPAAPVSPTAFLDEVSRVGYLDAPTKLEFRPAKVINSFTNPKASGLPPVGVPSSHDLEESRRLAEFDALEDVPAKSFLARGFRRAREASKNLESLEFSKAEVAAIGATALVGIGLLIALSRRQK